MDNKSVYNAINEFFRALCECAEPLWPCVTVPLPTRRHIGQHTVWPTISLFHFTHNGQVFSTDDIYSFAWDLSTEALIKAASDIRAARKSAKNLAGRILQCQSPSAEMLRKELNAMFLTDKFKPVGDERDLLLPVARRLDHLKYGDWEVRQVIAMATRLVAQIPDDLEMRRSSRSVAIIWKDLLTVTFEFGDTAPDSWVTITISDRKGDIDYFGLSGLAQRLTVTCQDPDSAIALMEILDTILGLLEEK